MAWTTPKVWNVEPIGFSSLNNIENNLKYLREDNKIINGTNTFTNNIAQTAGVTSLKATTITTPSIIQLTLADSFTDGRAFIEWENNLYFGKTSTIPPLLE